VKLLPFLLALAMCSTAIADDVNDNQKAPTADAVTVRPVFLAVRVRPNFTPVRNILEVPADIVRANVARRQAARAILTVPVFVPGEVDDSITEALANPSSQPSSVRRTRRGILRRFFSRFSRQPRTFQSTGTGEQPTSYQTDCTQCPGGQCFR